MVLARLAPLLFLVVAIDGTTIGGTTPAAADFTTMDTTGNASVGGTFDVTGRIYFHRCYLCR